MDEKIKKLLNSLIINDKEGNYGKIAWFFRKYPVIPTGAELLAIIKYRYDEEKMFQLVISMLTCGYNPNVLNNKNQNFIQIAIDYNYSSEFLKLAIESSVKYGLNINNVDIKGFSIVHNLIQKNYSLKDINDIYNLLCNNGYNLSSNYIDNKNLLEFLREHIEIYLNKFTNSFNKAINIDSNLICDNYSQINNLIDLSNDARHLLESNGCILNYKDYSIVQAIGRDKELEQLFIGLLQDKKNIILVGEAGVGKTAIIDEFIYRIKHNEVPRYFLNKTVFQLDVASAIANTKYRGDLEEKILKIIKTCAENNIILFIDEIHNIYGSGRVDTSNLDIASIIKLYMDRYNLKVIGITTNQNYIKYFSQDSFKRRFEKINVEEPDDFCLYKIIENSINICSQKYNINLNNIKSQLSSLINLLIDLTNKKCRIYDDQINNPDLVISIIDKAFAFAQLEEKNVINFSHFIKGINSCNRIYDSIKINIEESINELLDLNHNVHNKSKIIQINFNKSKLS